MVVAVAPVPEKPKIPKPIGDEMSIFIETVQKNERNHSELSQRPFLETAPIACNLWTLL